MNNDTEPAWQPTSYGDGFLCWDYRGYLLMAKPCGNGQWQWSAEARGDNPGMDHYHGTGRRGFVLSRDGKLPKQLCKSAVDWRHKYRTTLLGKWVLRQQAKILL